MPKWFGQGKLGRNVKIDAADIDANADSLPVSSKCGLHLLNEEFKTSESRYNVDIVAVHGLGGSAQHTWTHDDGKMWLRDFLPSDMPGARIFTFNYDSAFLFSRATGRLRDFARSLLNELWSNRVSAEEQSRNIIFLCHSMGGIVVKQALILASTQAKLYPGLSASVSGILFLATPQQGSATADYGSVLSKITNLLLLGSQASRITGRMRTDLLQSLRTDSEELLHLAEDFQVYTESLHIASFIEQKVLPGLKERVVDERSGYIGAFNERRFPMPGCDHKDICRFSEQDTNYRQIVGVLKASVLPLQQNMSNTQGSKDFRAQFRLDRIPSSSCFVERPLEMKAMEQSLLPTSAHEGRKLHVLHGLGGGGKTQLAVAFAKAQQKSFSAILWLDGESRQSLLQSLADFGERANVLRVPGLASDTSLDPQDVEGQAQDVIEWLANDGNDSWLMIFDNVDREYPKDGHDPQAYDVTAFFPPVTHGSILITTRLSSLDESRNSTKIEGLGLEQAMELLSDRSNLSTSTEGMSDLARRLKYLPLALVQAGTYIRRLQINCVDYLELYESSWLQLLQQTPRLSDYKNGSIMTTWNISYERIKQISPLSAELLQLWVLLDYRDIWYDLFSPAKETHDGSTLVAKLAESQLSFNSILEPLLRYSLVESSRVDGSYALHPVVHDWSAQVIGAHTKHFLILAMSITESVNRSLDSQPSFVGVSRLLPHVARLVAHLDPLGSDLTIVYDLMDFVMTMESLMFMHGIGHGIGHEAEKIHQWMLKKSKLVVGVDPSIQIEMMCRLANRYETQGESSKLAELEATLLSHIEYREHLQSKFALLELCSLLGTLYKAQNKIAEAESMYGRIMNTSKAADASGQISKKILLKTYHDLGNLYVHQGRIDEADHHLHRALSDIETNCDPEDHSARFNIEYLLTMVYIKQDKLHDAEVLCRRLLKEADDGSVGKVNVILAALTLICFSQAKYAESEKYWKDTADFVESLVGPYNPLTLAGKKLLGDVRRFQCKWSKAEECYQMVLGGYQETETPGDSTWLGAVAGLGRVYCSQKRFTEAEELYRKALEGFQEIGNHEQDVCRAMLDLCQVYDNQGKTLKTQDMCDQVYQRFGNVSDEKYAQDTRILRAFAVVCQRLGNTADAADFETKAKAAEASERVGHAPLGSHHNAAHLGSMITHLRVISAKMSRRVGGNSMMSKPIWTHIKRLKP